MQARFTRQRTGRRPGRRRGGPRAYRRLCRQWEFPKKATTCKRLEGATQALKGSPLFELSCEGGHGRIDTRKAAGEPISPVTTGLPGARYAITVQRDWCEKKAPQILKNHTRVFLSSPSVKENKALSTQAAREH